MKRRQAIVFVLVVSVVLCSTYQLYIETVPPQEAAAPGGRPTLVEGEIDLTVVPVWLPDHPPVTPLENLSRLVFQNLSWYFYNQSYGSVWLSGTVVSWVHVPHNTSYYARGSLLSQNKTRAENASIGASLFRRDVLAQLVWTRSNFTKQIMLVYSGSHTIHPHHSGIDQKESVVVDGSSIGVEISVVSELYTLSTMAHEMAHGFGLDDLYSKEPDRLGAYMGSWDLMDNPGSDFHISDMSAYSKIRLGWIKQGEIIDATDDITCELVSSDTGGDGTKVLRIKVDLWRFYLAEARPNEGDRSGVLITRVDCSRSVGGYGRAEIVRPARGTDPYMNAPVTFRPGEEFLDSSSGLVIRVVSRTLHGYTVEAQFQDIHPIEYQQDFELGRVLDVSSTTDHNGTAFVALSTLNATTDKRMVTLFRLNGRLERIVSLPSGNDTFNPVVVANEDQVMLIFESAYYGTSHIFAWFEEEILRVSEGDDAYNPTAATGLNGLYVAYENRTDNEGSIVVRKTSTYGWSKWTSFGVDQAAKVWPNQNGSASSPVLAPANNYAILSFLRTSEEKTTLEFKWEIDSPNSSLYFNQESIVSGCIDILDEYQVFLSIQRSSPSVNATDVYFLDMFEPDQVHVAARPYRSTGSACMMGHWEAYQSSDDFVIEQTWNSYRVPGVTINTKLDDSEPVGFGLCSINGTTGLFGLFFRNDSIEVRLWCVSSFAAGIEIPIPNALFIFTIEIMTGAVVGLVLIREYDKRVLKWLRGRLSLNKTPQQVRA